MIQAESRLQVADNTGAREIMCIKVLGGSRRRYRWTVGDVIVCSVKSVIPGSDIKKKADRSGGHRASAKKAHVEPTAATLSLTDNAAVIIDKDKNPRGTRIFGAVARELREKNYMKIVSLANEVI